MADGPVSDLAVSGRPGLMLVGHGSRSQAGVAEYWRLAGVLRQAAPGLEVGCGFIELARPRLDEGIETLVAAGATSVVAVPLVLLGAGHMKDDGPAALHRARGRHPGVVFRYARHLGIHPTILALAETRAREATADGHFGGIPSPGAPYVILVGRGSSDPDANSDLCKVARLVWDGRGFAGVEAAFVSLASPSVPEALDRCRRLGARRVAVVPYFLFTGVLVDRIGAQARAWAESHPDVEVTVGPHLGPVGPVADVVLERYHEALAGGAVMNCDLCVYRTPLPGHEHRVGAPIPGR
ncbi:MAG: sirohydrochlorin chelatase [Actinomycetota bacterium]|nr:sirohydrochlorin chelatase [Actinomycetota bacterium]